MDPVTAFSLAAGVLQVIDLSFKALSKCKEMYKDGSLAQHRDAKTFTEYLGKCSDTNSYFCLECSNDTCDQLKQLNVSRHLFKAPLTRCLKKPKTL
jgi:hypothetical protein